MSSTEDRRRFNRGQGMKAEDTFPPNWREIMIECGKQGKNNSEIFIKLNIHRDTHYEIMKRNEDYQDAYNEYLKHCEQWWFNKAHEAIQGPDSKRFNDKLWTTIMKNKFKDGWRDERQIDVTTAGEKLGANPIQIEVLRRGIDDTPKEDNPF